MIDRVLTSIADEVSVRSLASVAVCAAFGIHHAARALVGSIRSRTACATHR